MAARRNGPRSPAGQKKREQKRKICEQLKSVFALGATVDEAASIVGMSRKTLERMIRSDREVEEAVRLGTQEADRRVEMALYRRAVGCERRVEKIVSTGKGRYEVVELTEELPPDVSAARFWLNARRPETWGSVNSRGGTVLEGDVPEGIAGEVQVRFYLVAPRKDDGEMVSVPVMPTRAGMDRVLFDNGLALEVEPTEQGEDKK